MNPVAPTALVAALQSIIPNVGLSCQGLPDTPIDLWLIPAELPTERMDDEVVRRIWQDTPYWVFCWASGLAMARWLLAEPELVRGKTVLDFGTGSGVVAIAARLAGAARVIACDIDPVSLAATRANAALNGVQLEYLADLYALPDVVDVLLAADVLYDQCNQFFLDDFLRFGREVWVADSRVKNFSHPAYVKAESHSASTWPDLDESPEFRNVSFYRTLQAKQGECQVAGF
ncbi:MAG: methyltransferase [Flavobacteriales bacterium]